MTDFSRILFPVAFSERCRAAARHVAALATRYGSEITLLHVVEIPLTRPGELDFGALAFEADLDARTRTARELLNNFAHEALPEAADPRRIVFSGDPARIIVREAHDHQVGLVMMPTHGYGMFRRFILGSVTAKVLHDAECPVWTAAHLPEPATDTAGPRHIMCAVDLSEYNPRPLLAARDLAREFAAELTVAHATLLHEAADEARTALTELLARLEIAAQVSIAVGDVAESVRGLATEHAADLLVIGRGQHSGLSGRLRTHSYGIIRESPCPVLSV